eukprot:c8970_g1_i1.p1 GENE.c8970_g1_i1~~c8970_g1_i1.p1  ORF type:complete len:426 (-),score=-31.23 c8970_g1_i1:68-1345(-)
MSQVINQISLRNSLSLVYRRIPKINNNRVIKKQKEKMSSFFWPTNEKLANDSEDALLERTGIFSNIIKLRVPVRTHSGSNLSHYIHTITTDSSHHNSPFRYTGPITSSSTSSSSSSSSSSSLMSNNEGNTVVNNSGSDNNGKRKETLVIAHGFGAGSAFFWKNIGYFANKYEKVYLIDWIGMGRSSRPTFRADNVEEAEDFFISAFEEWRENVGLKNEKIVLMGHSLGGYLAAAYTLKHPSKVKVLMMVSPVGLPEAPQVNTRTLPFFFRLAWFLWGFNLTPQGFIRFVGPKGPSLCSTYVNRRMEHLLESERKDLSSYLYHTMVDSGSGEYALNTILQPGAYARNPLINRLPGLQVPVSFSYGDHDWMDKKTVYHLSKNNLFKVHHDIVIVPNAGHHLYLDNADDFNDMVSTSLDGLLSTLEST